MGTSNEKPGRETTLTGLAMLAIGGGITLIPTNPLAGGLLVLVGFGLLYMKYKLRINE